MTTDPQVLDGSITISGPGAFRPMSATELLADPPLTPADRARIAGLTVVLLLLLVSVVAGMWLLAPNGWLS